MKRMLIVLTFLAIAGKGMGQAVPNPRPITMAEYEKAKTFAVKDLDKDSYVKFENTYILDRYEMRKPYFITGDDGLRKRIDLYKLVAKEGMQELGTMIFYTNEKGKLYTALQPNFTADAKLWDKYFNDIDNINKEEKNFILKLSYVLSREMSFQLYKAINKGKDLKEESATYGTDICFPGKTLVTMADGTKKKIADIKRGEKIVTIDPVTKNPVAATVTNLNDHVAKNYAITSLLLWQTKEENKGNSIEVFLSAKRIEATPNHPVTTLQGRKPIGKVNELESIACWDKVSGSYRNYTVILKEEKAEGVQKVYNIAADKGSTLLMNDVLVLQK